MPQGRYAEKLAGVVTGVWERLNDHYANGEIVVKTATMTAPDTENPLFGSTTVSYTERRFWGLVGDRPQYNEDGTIAGGSNIQQHIEFVAPLSTIGMTYQAFSDLLRKPEVAIDVKGERVNVFSITEDLLAGCAVVVFERLKAE